MNLLSSILAEGITRRLFLPSPATPLALSSLGAGGLSSEQIEARVRRLVVLTNLHRAERQHRPTAALRNRLRELTAEVLA